VSYVQVFIMKFQVVFAILAFACSALAAPARVEPQIFNNLANASTTNVLITFRKSDIQRGFAQFDSLNLANREAKLNTMYFILKDHADTVQADVVSVLKKLERTKRHQVSQLWITAELIVRNVDKETVELLRNHPDVESLVAEQFIPLEEVVEEEYTPINPLWGVSNINAQAVWNSGITGAGVVVAAIDTGARLSHQGLTSNYRGTVDGTSDYNWFAPTGLEASPSDSNGHGTHVTGTIAGTTNTIGVAPGSTWIHCRGCATSACSTFDLVQCGNFIACPTNTAGTAPNCARAPNVVNNSWGGGQGNTFYDAVIAEWRRVGIVPIFSAGNSGTGCSSVISPSDRPGSIAIASTTDAGGLSAFSSRGPTTDGRLKPEVAAPGSNIISASHLADNEYRTLSGTSMAAPHAAGLVALILQAQPNLDVDQVLAALQNGAQAINPGGQTCGGIPDSVRPNNQVGAGLISAPAAIAAAASIAAAL